MLESLIHVPPTFGYGLLFLLVGTESAGVPLPGETALLTAAVLAAQGHLSLPLVIAFAAAAAIIGDNVGYVIGRGAVRPLLTRSGRFQGRRARLLADGEAFFARHGAKAVFLGRWVTGVRVVVAWLAGADRMPWPRFAFWNLLGGVAWASSIALLAYWIGSASSSILGALGLVGLIVAFGAVLGYFVSRRLARTRRHERPVLPRSAPPGSPFASSGGLLPSGDHRHHADCGDRRADEQRRVEGIDEGPGESAHALRAERASTGQE
jgi:undecaprenyl-diphosphatase